MDVLGDLALGQIEQSSEFQRHWLALDQSEDPELPLVLGDPGYAAVVQDRPFLRHVLARGHPRGGFRVGRLPAEEVKHHQGAPFMPSC